MSEDTTEHKRSYKVGHRKDFLRKKEGKLSKSRWGWVKVYFGQITLWVDYRLDKNDQETDEVLDMKLLIPLPNRQPIAWNLTAATEEELISLKHFLDTAIEWALPIARQRDKEAQDAFDNGDDSHSRIYRSVPQLVYRTRPEPEHGEGVHDRSPDAAGVPRDGADHDGGLRAGGSDLVEPDESSGGAEDDWSEADEPESLRPVGEVGDGGSQ